MCIAVIRSVCYYEFYQEHRIDCYFQNGEPQLIRLSQSQHHLQNDPYELCLMGLLLSPSNTYSYYYYYSTKHVSDRNVLFCYSSVSSTSISDFSLIDRQQFYYQSTTTSYQSSEPSLLMNPDDGLYSFGFYGGSELFFKICSICSMHSYSYQPRSRRSINLLFIRASSNFSQNEPNPFSCFKQFKAFLMYPTRNTRASKIGFNQNSISSRSASFLNYIFLNLQVESSSSALLTSFQHQSLGPQMKPSLGSTTSPLRGISLDSANLSMS